MSRTLPPIAVTVVVPLLRSRKTNLDGLIAWTLQTLADGTAVEVMAVSAGDIALELRARQILRSEDRLLLAPGEGEAGLWDRGARAARGRVVLLTECHSVPEPSALQAAMRALDDGLDVACFESRAPVLGAAAQLEDAMYQDLFARHADLGDPRAISLRAVALPKELYLVSGGLRSADHECFAERALAARLAACGARIGRAPGAVVEHIPNSTFRAMRSDSRAFHKDEITARLAGTASGIDPRLHLETPPAWESRAKYDRALQRGALPGLFALAGVRTAAARAAAAALPGTAVRAVLGARAAAATAGVRARVAFAWYALRWRAGRRPDPRPTWSALARASVLRALAALPPGVLRRDATAGLHPPEEHRGQALRWTEPIFVLDAPASGAIHLPVNAAVRPLSGSEVSVACGRRRLREPSLRIAPDAVTVDVPAGTGQPLVFAVPPFHAAGDRRRLGLPLMGRR